MEEINRALQEHNEELKEHNKKLQDNNGTLQTSIENLEEDQAKTLEELHEITTKSNPLNDKLAEHTTK